MIRTNGCDIVLQMTEERFDRCVVETVAPTGHGLNQSEVANESLVARMGIVEALVRMNHRLGMSLLLEMLFELFHRLKDEVHVKTRGQLVCHDLACGDVLHTRQIDVLAGGDREVGDIGHEYLPGLALPELAVQSVRHDAVLVRRPRELAIRVHPPDFGHDVIFAHQPKNPFMVDRETEGSEHLHVQPPITDFAFVAIMDFLEECRI